MRTPARALGSVTLVSALAGTVAQQESSPGIYAIPVRGIDGRVTTLEPYRGKAILIVNVASKCGFTPQYAGLQTLHERYRAEGLIVLGFPANDFLRQEPGTDSEIKQFCSLNYGVTFPVFAKISVKGKAMHPLFRFLTAKATNPEHAGRITWNFNKFLIGRDGRVVARFGSRVKPGSDKVAAAIKDALLTAE